MPMAPPIVRPSGRWKQRTSCRVRRKRGVENTAQKAQPHVGGSLQRPHLIALKKRPTVEICKAVFNYHGSGALPNTLHTACK